MRTPLSWEKGHPQRKYWSDKLFEVLSRPEIFNALDRASDIERIYPAWRHLARDQKINVFAEFWCQVSQPESGWDDKVIEGGKASATNEDGLGLYQFSYNDQISSHWDTGHEFSAPELLTFGPNIEVSLYILKTVLSRKNKIIIKKTGPDRVNEDGVFWAVIYEGGKFDDSPRILEHMRNFKLQLQDAPKEPSGTVSPTPWVLQGIKMLGWTEDEYDKELVAFCWPNTDDCRGLNSVRGSENAWCSGWVCGCLERAGIRGSRSGSADSYQKYGEECGFVFGAILPITHASGKHHVNFFLWWIDEKKTLAACLGGNQGNLVSIGAYDLSGKLGADRVVPSPRWPKGWPKSLGPYKPDGWEVGTKIGSSTR